jgi:cyclase
MHRLIARLDIKGSRLIKGVHLEGLRPLGDPHDFALRYYEAGIDELLYMDCVASLYGRNQLLEFLKKTAENIFVPITVGGGIRSVHDAREILRAGADKVAINSAAIRNPDLIREVALTFGSQCMVLSIEAKRTQIGKWEAYIESGREKTGVDAIEWAKVGAELGAGEILLTSIDQEGTRQGCDLPLISEVSRSVNIPVIASGGVGKPRDIIDAILEGSADAVAIADVLHYGRFSIAELRKALCGAGVRTREISI